MRLGGKGSTVTGGTGAGVKDITVRVGYTNTGKAVVENTGTHMSNKRLGMRGSLTLVSSTVLTTLFSSELFGSLLIQKMMEKSNNLNK